MSVERAVRALTSPRAYRIVFGCLLTLAACLSLLGVWSLPFVDGVDLHVYDARMRLQEAPAASDVVIVDIDERSLAEIGRWPWPRGRLAELARAISDRGHAAVIGFDILFAEAQAEPGQDEALAATLAQTPTVLGYYLSSDRGGRANGKLPTPVMDARAVSDLHLTMTNWTGYSANIELLQNSARGAGFYNPIIDSDGVIRVLPLLGGLGDRVYESFAVALLRQYLGNAALILRDDTIELHGRRGDVTIPLSDGLGALVPYARLQTSKAMRSMGDLQTGSGRFLTIPAADVLENKADWALLKDKIVLIGTSTPGLTDLRATPISETLPGVEIHAALIDSLLHPAGTRGVPPVRQRSSTAPVIGALALALVGLALAFAMPSGGAVGVLVLGVCGIAGLIAWNEIAYWRLGWVLPESTGVLTIAALTGINLALGYFLEGRARRAVSNLFGEYVSPELVDRMTRDPARYARMISENRELSIMFSDIRGFTRIAESMEPADLREYINEFLTAMTEVIHRHHGTVDKYIGDAVMAFWGAPVEDPEHADHAVSAAQEMLLEVERLNRINARRGWPTLVIGVGINTGVARVGDMGSKLRRAYTVLGDAVNLASRIESLTKQFGTPIIVGESTARQAHGHRFSELAQVSIAGRNEQVRIYVPSSADTTAQDELHPVTMIRGMIAVQSSDQRAAGHEVTRLRM